MNFKLKLDALVVIQQIDGQDVLFSKKTGDFFGINESAAFMLKILIDTDFQSAIRQASSSFNVDQETISSDLMDLVDSLVESKLAEKIPL